MALGRGLLVRLLPAGLVVLASAGWLFHRRQKAKARTAPPRAPYTPWQLLQLFQGPCWPETLLLLCREMATPVFRVRRLPWGDIYVADDWQLAQRIFHDKETDKPKGIRVINAITGGRPSLFTALTRSAEWQAHRRHVAPAFRTKVLGAQTPALRAKLGDFYAILAEHAAQGTPVDMDDLLMYLTLDFISLSAFDYDLCALREQSSEGRRFLQSTSFVLAEMTKRVFEPLRRWKFWLHEAHQLKADTQWMKELSLRILRAYRAAHPADAIATDDRILAHLIRDSQYPDEEARAADVTMFLVAGHDTTAHTLAWTLYELSQRPELQGQVHAELDAVAAGLEDDAVSWAQLGCLNRCLKESMRLWPVAASGPMRQVGVPFEAHGVVIPKGALVRLPFISLFRPRWLAAPDDFVPDRWVDPAPELESLLTPFSVGPRNCVGQNLATLELRAVLVGTLRRFSFELVQPPRPEFAVTMKPRGLQLRVHCRDAVQ
eukprot:EG_transcript_7411